MPGTMLCTRDAIENKGDKIFTPVKLTLQWLFFIIIFSPRNPRGKAWPWGLKTDPRKSSAPPPYVAQVLSGSLEVKNKIVKAPPWLWPVFPFPFGHRAFLAVMGGHRTKFGPQTMGRSDVSHIQPWPIKTAWDALYAFVPFWQPRMERTDPLPPMTNLRVTHWRQQNHKTGGGWDPESPLGRKLLNQKTCIRVRQRW